ncbi:MAG TPA: hypothetical protein VG269_10630 [Tepidisphaeraceae bacterium]|jgi:hypothetical protein|nr:hypothetical protein [Tepidisphaeraceae bacterium]
MFSAKNTGRGLLACTLLGLLLFARSARAEDDSLTQVGVVAVKSLDATAAFAKQIGMELPPPLTAKGLEQQFPFIGSGGLATDKPVGIILFGGPGVKSDQQMMTFVFPVKPTAATLESLKSMGAKALPGHADTVLMNGVGFRRTGDYLAFGPLPEAAATAKLESVADAVKGANALARLVVDLKAVRVSMPEQYASVLEAISMNATAKDAQQAGMQVMISAMRQGVEKFDRVELGLDGADGGLRIALAAAPLKLPAPPPGDRPGLPANAIARVDAPVPLTSILSNEVLKKLTARDAPEGLTVKQEQKFQDLNAAVWSLFLGGEGQTAGMEVSRDAPVAYMVKRYDKPIDFALELRRLVAQAKAFGDATHHPVEMELQSYKIGEEQALRVVISDSEKKPALFLDVLQRGNTVFIAGSKNEFRYVDRLLAAKADGPQKALASASVDLGRLFDAATKTPGSPLVGMPADRQKQLEDVFRGQTLAVSLTSEGDTATIDLTLPPALTKNIPRLVKVVSDGAGKNLPGQSPKGAR